jgi:hypothetical protein
MPKTDTKSKQMTEDEIREVFTDLQLPTSPPPQPAPVVQPTTGPVVFYTITGNSPPLNTR